MNNSRFQKDLAQGYIEMREEALLLLAEFQEADRESLKYIDSE
jgi:hypothetical protein